MDPRGITKDLEKPCNISLGPTRSKIIFRTAILSWILVIGTLGIFVLINIPYQKKAIEESMISEARSIAASIARVTATAIVSKDYGAVVEHCLRVVKESPSLLYVVVTRHDGFSLTHTKKEWKQTQLGAFWNPADHRSASNQFLQSDLISEPAFHHSHPLQYSGIDWGWIHIGLSQKKYNADVRNLYIRTLWLAIFCIFLAMIPSLIFARKLSRPIHHLDSVTQRVATGDLAVRANVTTGDELERLAQSFNRMTEAMQKSRDELLSSRENTNNIIGSMNDTLIVIDPSGTIKTLNRAASKLLGYSEEELLGSSIQKILVSNRDHPSSASVLQVLKQNNGLANIETAYWSKENQRIPVLFSAAVMRGNDDKAEGWVCVALDITERKKAEDELRQAKNAAEQANRAKSEFLANMSHELRTPLNAIIGFSEILIDRQGGDLNQLQEEYLRDIHQSSRHLLALINDILDLSKVEAGKMELELAEVSLKPLLANSLVMIRERALKHAIQLHFEEEEGLPPTIRADERKIKQALFNLLSNAVKFTPEQGIICLQARTLSRINGHWVGSDKQVVALPLEANPEGDGKIDYLWISVADSGVGILPQDWKRIFAPFEQADNSASRRYQGTGLGLPLTKRLVELHGGRIWGESEGAGKGSTFSFVIPVDPRPGNAKNPNPRGIA